MLVKMAEDMFTTLFGNARPLVINDGYDALQLKYDLRAINPYMLTSGFEKLKKSTEEDIASWHCLLKML